MLLSMTSQQTHRISLDLLLRDRVMVLNATFNNISVIWI
jgi:hypothetical protein